MLAADLGGEDIDVAQHHHDHSHLRHLSAVPLFRHHWPDPVQHRVPDRSAVFMEIPGWGRRRSYPIAGLRRRTAGDGFPNPVSCLPRRPVGRESEIAGRGTFPGAP